MRLEAACVHAGLDGATDADDHRRLVEEALTATEPPPPRPPLAPAMPARLDRLELDYAALDAPIADTNRAVERVQRLFKNR